MSRHILDALMQLFALITLRRKGLTVAVKWWPTSCGAASTGSWSTNG